MEAAQILELAPFWAMLVVLQDFAGRDGLSGREVAELAEVSPTTAIKYLHALEASGSVARCRIGRADRWTLTEAGSAFLGATLGHAD